MLAPSFFNFTDFGAPSQIICGLDVTHTLMFIEFQQPKLVFHLSANLEHSGYLAAAKRYLAVGGDCACDRSHQVRIEHCQLLNLNDAKGNNQSGDDVEEDCY